MTIQTFDLYTKRGYAGQECDSGPSTTATGICEDATLGFGLAVQRGTAERGVKVGSVGTDVFGITRREYNHEADTRPSDGSTSYKETDSVSVLRDGAIYVELVAAATAGNFLAVHPTAGTFSGTTGGGHVLSTNVVAEQSGSAGDIVKARLIIAK